jgi:hypothetical protein
MNWYRLFGVLRKHSKTGGNSCRKKFLKSNVNKLSAILECPSLQHKSYDKNMLFPQKLIGNFRNLFNDRKIADKKNTIPALCLNYLKIFLEKSKNRSCDKRVLKK